IAAESETAEMVAPLLFGPARDVEAAASAELGQRRVIRVEVLELDLREEAGHDIRRRCEQSGNGVELSGQHAHQGRFAGAIASENSDSIAGVYRKRDILDNTSRAVSRGHSFEREERSGQ